MTAIKINGTIYIGNFYSGLNAYIIYDYSDYMDEDRENELGKLYETSARGWVFESCDFDQPQINCQVQINNN